MAVKTYQKAERIQLTEHFNSREFRCGLGRPSNCTTTGSSYTMHQLITDVQHAVNYIFEQDCDAIGGGEDADAE